MADPVRLLSSVNALETALVMEARKGDPGGRELDLFLHRSRIDVVPFTQDPVEEARNAWRRYGKANHGASLNFFDCSAYALSKTSGEPLLFKGHDFSHTDVIAVLKPAVQPTAPVLVLVLERTYHLQGFFNVPVDFDRYLGPDNSSIEIHLDDSGARISGTINRRAQSNGTARIMGGVALRNHFQSSFKQGDIVDVIIESPQRLRIRSGSGMP